MDNNVRIVPIQQVCMLCPNELPARDATQGLASRLCRQCIKVVREQVFREIAANPKIVRV
jgi:hypothetical protein